MEPAQHPITRWLARQPSWVLTTYAMVVSFATYFCMYAFRKPFSAASYTGATLGDTGIALKTAFVVSQLVGYTLSKYLGVKVLSELTRRGRLWLLLGLVGFAQLALVGFGALPAWGRVAAIFANGLPLGMVWGVVVTYLEGRRTSEMMLAGLSCSFIVASGAVKDVGRWVMSSFGVADVWMPCVVGLMFAPAFALAAWLLDRMPPQTRRDEDERHVRTPMNAAQRRAFVTRFGAGMAMLLVAHVMLSAYRDFRDSFGVELFEELGLGGEPAIFTRTELPVSFGVMLVLGLLTLVRDNRRGFLGAYAIMCAGAATIGVSTVLMERGVVGGAGWMILIGLGAYLAYVPFGSVLFDRLIAFTRAPGTAVFAIYLMDATGYTGSVALQLSKDTLFRDVSRLDFFVRYSYLMSAVGGTLLVLSAIFFVALSRRPPAPARAA
ncbi:MAG: hypothetical protein H6697_12070 [Myxococcales bacterium]|nr:hypothetical protein [Myxococcales bacterium]